MFGLEFAVLAELRRKEALAEQQFDADLLAMRLDGAPPEDHAQIHRDHYAALEKRRAEREVERRHRELCAAIRDAGRSYRRWL